MQPCILFLFENATVDTSTKYAFAAIGVFLMGFANEMIRCVWLDVFVSSQVSYT